jgi:hypothetical protein
MCGKFNTTGKSILIIRTHVKSQNQKYFSGQIRQIRIINCAILGPHEGRFAIVTKRRAEGAMDALVQARERGRMDKGVRPSRMVLAPRCWR